MMHSDALINRIDACLPQTQCSQCGYPDCLSYAKAIADGQAQINQCPPGGEITINALADVLNVPFKPLNIKYGQTKAKHIAKIIENECIGCTLCIKACPVDAIIGSNQLMHSILSVQCTGCELCLPVCPMDCIKMMPTESDNTNKRWPYYSEESVEQARMRRYKQAERLKNKSANTKHMARKLTAQDRSQLIQQAISRKLNKT